MRIEIYATFCGPQALAAVTGMTPIAAAKTLRAAAAAYGGDVPSDGATRQGDLAAALIALRCRLEMWSGAKSEHDPMYRPSELARIVRSRALPHPPEPPPSPAVLEVRRAVLAEPPPPEPERYTVREWLHRHPIGLWIIHVPNHVMAAKDGRILSGDWSPFQALADRVTAAIRIYPPTTPTLMEEDSVSKITRPPLMIPKKAKEAYERARRGHKRPMDLDEAERILRDIQTLLNARRQSGQNS